MRQDWDKRKIGEICEVLNGFAFKSSEYVENGIRVIRITNVQKGYVVDDDPKYYPMTTKESIKSYLLNSGDLLMSLTGNVGRVGVLQEEMLPAALNQRVACLRIKDKRVLLKYLFHNLNSPIFEQDCINSASGVAQKNMSTEWLKKYLIGIPPIAEQEKIVAELDCLTGIIEKKKQQLEELDNIAQSIFYDMFGSREYQKEQLISLCADKDDIKCGPFGTQLSKSEFLKDGVPVWGIPQVNSNFAISPTDFVSEEKALALQSFSIIGGDIVMSRKGNIGQSAIYPNSFESGILHSDVLRIRVKRELANPLFLVYQFHQSAEIKHQFKIIGYGAIMPGLNVSKLKNVIVDIPPITLQNEFAQKVEAIEKQKELVKQSIVETETLFNSRMDFWFNN